MQKNRNNSKKKRKRNIERYSIHGRVTDSFNPNYIGGEVRLNCMGRGRFAPPRYNSVGFSPNPKYTFYICKV